MANSSRRKFLQTLGHAAGASTALSLFPPAIARALAIPANNRTGTINDVEHVVIFMQENRSFEHYFGTLQGVRGFNDRFTIPMASGKPVWYQSDGTRDILPYRLDTFTTSAQAVPGTPHSWGNAQDAWNNGSMGLWPKFKTQYSMGYYQREDIPFQFALADAFTICDAYHCSVQGSTNPNRIFLWSGYNDPYGLGGGPTVNNQYYAITDGGRDAGFSWTTYPERLEAAGVSWQVYQNAADNYDDNALQWFRQYRDAYYDDHSSPLYRKGVSTRGPDDLKSDVLAGRLPQVSWVVATAKGSEHPSASTPIQGAQYTQAILDALTADPEVWSKTVLLIMFDENDGFFDHLPPPAVPSRRDDGSTAGKASMDIRSEYHADGKPFGLGPRVPLYVISPWSKGGWVNSQSFDHTSVLQFLERRFGVQETNISAWRRSVCGDLTSAFNFATPNDPKLPALPETSNADALVAAQRLLPRPDAPPSEGMPLPRQEPGVRPSRALPYELHTSARADARTGLVSLIFSNTGRAGAVFHVYDRRHLDRVPRRYTVGAGAQLSDTWRATEDDQGKYDLWVLGPNGFHRHFAGDLAVMTNDETPNPEIRVCYDIAAGNVYLSASNIGQTEIELSIAANAYLADGPWTLTVPAREQAHQHWDLAASGGWYDFTVTAAGGFLRRFSGRVETGRHATSDPAMG